MRGRLVRHRYRGGNKRARARVPYNSTGTTKTRTQRAVAWYNAQPPVSEDTFDTAILLEHPGKRLGILFGNGGKVCVASPVPEELNQGLLDAIAGETF